MSERSKGINRQRARADSSAEKPQLVTLKVSVDRETARLIRLEAFGRDVSLGQVVTEMARAFPRRFVLQDRSKGSQPPALPSEPTAPSSPPIVPARPSLGLLDAG